VNPQSHAFLLGLEVWTYFPASKWPPSHILFLLINKNPERAHSFSLTCEEKYCLLNRVFFLSLKHFTFWFLIFFFFLFSSLILHLFAIGFGDFFFLMLAYRSLRMSEKYISSRLMLGFAKTNWGLDKYLISFLW